LTRAPASNTILAIYQTSLPYLIVSLRLMVLSATFNNISVILWQSVLLVEKNHQPVTSHWNIRLC
jgi:hypothetical protein